MSDDLQGKLGVYVAPMKALNENICTLICAADNCILQFHLLLYKRNETGCGGGAF